MLGRLAGTDDL